MSGSMTYADHLPEIPLKWPRNIKAKAHNKKGVGGSISG